MGSIFFGPIIADLLLRASPLVRYGVLAGIGFLLLIFLAEVFGGGSGGTSSEGGGGYRPEEY